MDSTTHAEGDEVVNLAIPIVASSVLGLTLWTVYYRKEPRGILSKLKDNPQTLRLLMVIGRGLRVSAFALLGLSAVFLFWELGVRRYGTAFDELVGDVYSIAAFGLSFLVMGSHLLGIAFRVSRE